MSAFISRALDDALIRLNLTEAPAPHIHDFAAGAQQRAT
jgi:hypothetical protein